MSRNGGDICPLEKLSQATKSVYKAVKKYQVSSGILNGH